MDKDSTDTAPPPLEESAGYVRLALPLMSQYKIPITPRNYAVWYDYVSGKSRELRDAIDADRKAKTGSITYRQAKGLRVGRNVIAIRFRSNDHANAYLDVGLSHELRPDPAWSEQAK